MLRLQPSFGGSVEASHPHVKDHTAMIVRSAPASKIGRNRLDAPRIASSLAIDHNPTLSKEVDRTDHAS